MKRNITIIHHCGNIGGAGRSLIQTAKMLENEYNVTVLCPEGSDMQKLLMDSGISAVAYANKLGGIEYYSGGPAVLSRTYAKQALRRNPSWKEVKPLIAQTKPDVVMLNSITLSFMIPKIKKETSAKAICFVRETFPENGKKSFFKKYCALLNQADGVFFISDYDRLKFNLNIKYPITVKNSVPDSFFDSYDRNEALNELGIEPSENAFYVLYAGGSDRLKGIDILENAVSQLDGKVHLLIAGDDKENFSVSFKATAKKYNGRIHFIGMVRDMRKAYAACDALVFPSVKPHQARPAFEAGCFMKPVIISDFKQTNECVKDGCNGLCFAPCDSLSLAEKINTLAKDEKLCRKLGENNRAVSENNHSIDKVSGVLSDTVDKILSDTQVKYLHIMTASNYGTVDGYVKLVNENFDNKDHLFIIRDTKDNPQHSLEGFENIVWLPEAEKGELGRMFAYIDSAESVLWHSMGWYWTTQLKMLKKPSYMKKSTWVEWGADLFNWKRNDGNPIVRYGVNTIHRMWRKKVDSVVVIFPTDEDVYRKEFNKNQKIMLATYSVYRHTQIDEQKPEVFHNPEMVNILVGHSATPNAHHIEVLDSLAKFSDENIHIYIPLSYGEDDYAQQVIDHATKLFGDKVTFQMKNMPLWDYVHFLWDIDIAIFKVYRQIALGNICRLLYMTKKVYLPKGSLLYNYYEENDTEIYDCDAISDMTFDEFKAKPKMTEPSACIKERMNRGAVIEMWRNVFEKTGGN
ncbi:MAG: TDP-N-acetylfucosamine:lipid II N-acetylfucosaminyltransferase [Clostridia bacterium]|nr:TDP-N-acetylfucosamine:lipid II N-acetylfucosaminyltransferase [Clostridia bacterium]